MTTGPVRKESHRGHLQVVGAAVLHAHQRGQVRPDQALCQAAITCLCNAAYGVGAAMSVLASKPSKKQVYSV